jgi:hypothetical protein
LRESALPACAIVLVRISMSWTYSCRRPYFQYRSPCAYDPIQLAAPS